MYVYIGKFQKIHDTLSRHSFNTDAAAAELSRTYSRTIQQSTYSKWREEYDKNVSQKPVDTVGKRYAVGEPSGNKRKKGIFYDLQAHPIYKFIIIYSQAKTRRL